VADGKTKLSSWNGEDKDAKGCDTDIGKAYFKVTDKNLD